MSNAELPSLKQVAEDNLKCQKLALEVAQAFLDIKLKHLKISENPQISKNDASDFNQISLMVRRAAKECDRYSKILEKFK